MAQSQQKQSGSRTHGRNARDYEQARKAAASNKGIVAREESVRSVTLSCARSTTAIARLMSRLSAADKALVAEAESAPGVRQAISRGLMSTGSITVELPVETVKYEDGTSRTRALTARVVVNPNAK